MWKVIYVLKRITNIEQLGSGDGVNVRGQGLPNCLEGLVIEGWRQDVPLQARNCVICNSNRRRGHACELGHFESVTFLIDTWPQAVRICKGADLEYEILTCESRQRTTSRLSHLCLLHISTKETYFLKRPRAFVVRSAPEHVGELVEMRGEEDPTVILEVEMVHHREGYSQAISD